MRSNRTKHKRKLQKSLWINCVTVDWQIYWSHRYSLLEQISRLVLDKKYTSIWRSKPSTDVRIGSPNIRWEKCKNKNWPQTLWKKSSHMPCMFRVKRVLFIVSYICRISMHKRELRSNGIRRHTHSRYIVCILWNGRSVPCSLHSLWRRDDIWNGSISKRRTETDAFTHAHAP